MPSPGNSSITVGIDLASQAKRTAAAVIEWGRPGAQLVAVHDELTDEAILEIASADGVAKIGIDAPFGWPGPFVEAVSTYAITGCWPTAERRALAFRATDLCVRKTTGQWPLSVSTNFIAYIAIRCAELLSQLLPTGALDRTGAGIVAEVYPAAALRVWHLPSTGYKGETEGNRHARANLVAEILRAADSRLDVNGADRARLRASDHVLDALIAALVARAVQTGAVVPISAGHERDAELEGWIRLPSDTLSSLFTPSM